MLGTRPCLCGERARSARMCCALGGCGRSGVDCRGRSGTGVHGWLVVRLGLEGPKVG